MKNNKYWMKLEQFIIVGNFFNERQSYLMWSVE